MGRAAAVLLPAAILVVYALRDGSYDIVARQEATVVVWLILALGLALGLLPRARIQRDGLILIAVLGALAAWTLLALAWSESAGRTLAEAIRVLHYLGLVLLVWSVVTRDTWREVVAGLTLGAVVVALLATASRLIPGAFPEDEVSLVLEIDRLSYPLAYWNAVGGWGAIAGAMALAWSAHLTQPVARCVALAVIPACWLSVHLTYSRAGLGAIVLGCVLVIALSRNRWTAFGHAAVAGAATAVLALVVRGYPEVAKGTGDEGGAVVALLVLVAAAVCAGAAWLTLRFRVDERVRLPLPTARRALAVAGVAVVVLALAATAAGAVGEAWDSFSEPRAIEPGEDPTERLGSLSGTRYTLWSASLRAFETDPLKGIGPGTFEFWWNRDSGDDVFLDAHSIAFDGLAEAGVPGALLALAVLVWLAVMVVRRRLQLSSAGDFGPYAAAAAAFGTFFALTLLDWMWEATALAALALGAAAVATLPLDRRERPLGLPLRLGLAIVAVLVALAALPGLASTRLVRDSQEAFRAGDDAEALSDADAATEAEPWAAEPWVQRGLVLEAEGRLDAAALDFRRATDREPTNYRLYYPLIRVETLRNRPDEAIAAYQEQRRLRPLSRFNKPAE